MLRLLVFAASLLFAGMALAGPTGSTGPAGQVRVIDGDTFRVGGTRVRLYGLDAPETSQTCKTEQGVDWACGAWSKSVAETRFGGRHATCDALYLDAYGRTVATCAIDGADVGQVLVRDGVAFAFRKYSSDYVKDEELARAADTGLWAMQVQSPSQYRLIRVADRKKASAQAAGDCNIKGNISRSGERIYHVPGQKYYSKTKISPGKGERWFCSEQEARRAGWRKAKV